MWISDYDEGLTVLNLSILIIKISLFKGRSWGPQSIFTFPLLLIEKNVRLFFRMKRGKCIFTKCIFTNSQNYCILISRIPVHCAHESRTVLILRFLILHVFMQSSHSCLNKYKPANSKLTQLHPVSVVVNWYKETWIWLSVHLLNVHDMPLRSVRYVPTYMVDK